MSSVYKKGLKVALTNHPDCLFRDDPDKPSFGYVVTDHDPITSKYVEVKWDLYDLVYLMELYEIHPMEGYDESLVEDML